MVVYLATHPNHVVGGQEVGSLLAVVAVLNAVLSDDWLWCMTSSTLAFKGVLVA